MTEIFISHAVADKALADKLVSFLKEAIGVPAKSIFCSSVEGQGIPLGDDFNDYMKKQIQEPKLVILLMTPRYMESWFCLMELGATWAKSLTALPIVVPPVRFSVVSSTLGLKQGWSIDDHSKLVDLRTMITATGIGLEPRTEHDWDKKRAAWKVDLRKAMKKLACATSVSASEHQEIRDELIETTQELESLQEAYAEAGELIDELKAAKDAAAVSAIMSKKNGKNTPETQFKSLMEEILDLQPKVSIHFYMNIIMDYYGKSAPIDWFDNDQKRDAENAVQYNLMEVDEPHGYLWGGKKLKKVAGALKALDSFLESDEGSSFAKAREAAGYTMDTDDLEFWEENLG